MIDEMKINHRVKGISIRFRDDNPITSKMIEQINRKWKNVYRVWIEDWTDRVDKERHKILKEMMEQKSLFKFGLQLWGDLYWSKGGIKLMKEYNMIIKEKENLEQLRYTNNRINEPAESRQKVLQLIAKIENL